MSCNAKKDPNGTWRIQYRWTDWTGTKKKSQKRGFKTKKEAEEWYAHFMLQQSSDPTMTLADFWEIYKADMEKRLRKTTMKQKEYVMNDKVLPYFGKTPINEITAPMIRKWQGELIEKGFKPTYLKTIHNQLSAILNYAVNFYDLRSNPCRKAGSMGKSKADERPYWTLEEFQKFSDAIMDKQDSWIGFQILFWTGMRIGELLALQVKDIDFEQGTLTVDESLTRLDGEDLITAPKTESSVRVITIHKELQDEIKEYIATLYHVRPGTRLFAGRTKSFFEHEMERGIKLSGVKKITVHCIRHSHASMLVQMGFSPVEIAKRLGHGKVTTTIETYCHQSMDAQEKQLDIFNSWCVDGIITYGQGYQNLFQKYDSLNCPVVCIESPGGNQTDNVIIDDCALIREAITDMIQCGHRKIGCIYGVSDAYTTIQRTNGYKEGLLVNKIKADDTIIRCGESTLEGGYRETNWLLENTEIDAIFVENNLMTLGCVKALFERGVEIPDQIALLGYDDDDWRDTLVIPISSIHPPRYEMGEKATRLLLQRINYPKRKPITIKLSPELIKRKSY